MRRYTKTVQLPLDASQEFEHASRPEAKSLLTTVLIPLGSFLVAGLGLLVQAVPWWVTATIIFYVLVVALVALVPATIRIYRMVRRVTRHHAIARRYLPMTRRFLTTLTPNLEDSRVGTVYQVWRSATSLDQGRGLVRPDQVHLITLQWWFHSIGERLKNARNKQFDQIADELAFAVLQYTRMCEQAHREIEALLISGVRDEPFLRNLKHEWSNARDKHNQTIKAWEDIAKNINHDAGERICLDHYDLLKIVG